MNALILAVVGIIMVIILNLTMYSMSLENKEKAKAEAEIMMALDSALSALEAMRDAKYGKSPALKFVELKLQIAKLQLKCLYRLEQWDEANKKLAKALKELHEYKLAVTAEEDKVDEIQNRVRDKDNMIKLLKSEIEAMVVRKGLQANKIKALQAQPKPCEYKECSYCIALQQEIDELREGLERNFQKGRRVEIEAQPKLSKPLSKQEEKN